MRNTIASGYRIPGGLSPLDAGLLRHAYRIPFCEVGFAEIFLPHPLKLPKDIFRDFLARFVVAGEDQAVQRGVRAVSEDYGDRTELEDLQEALLIAIPQFFCRLGLQDGLFFAEQSLCTSKISASHPGPQNRSIRSRDSSGILLLSFRRTFRLMSITGKLTSTSIVFVPAIALSVSHSSDIPKGSRNAIALL